MISQAIRSHLSFGSLPAGGPFPPMVEVVAVVHFQRVSKQMAVVPRRPPTRAEPPLLRLPTPPFVAILLRYLRSNEPVANTPLAGAILLRALVPILPVLAPKPVNNLRGVVVVVHVADVALAWRALHQAGNAVDHAGMVRSPCVDVGAAQQADRGQRGARRSPGAVAVAVHRLLRTTGSEVEKLARLLDDAIVHEQARRLVAAWRAWKLPPDVRRVAISAGGVPPTAVRSLSLLDEIDRGLCDRFECGVFRHSICFA